ncbi:MAG TPA: phosphoribosylglycinamide formyltransferase [Saprospiraceae bacterium]|nr:phosphoribosylglycinamide formyltransferase [Saprospiraceae bacterium]
MTNIAILASGTGSNARKIVEYFSTNEDIHVKLIASNNAKAKVLDLANEYDLHKFAFDRSYFYNSQDFLKLLKKERIDFIILAGFLWMLPEYLIKAFPDRIINIHPSLLPKYGGKGMYGHHVHEAVKANSETESGITIHLVNEEYDRGRVIFQRKVQLDAEDSAEMIAKKVLEIEHEFFPRVIEDFILTF